MKIEAYTRERDCVGDAKHTFQSTGKTQLIFKKGRKYVYTTGELRQQGDQFINVFGDICYFSERSDICKKYENNGYELRGWVNSQGSFKNN